MGKLTDKLVGQGTAPELSPNPNGSGYTKQVEIISHNGSTIYFLDGDGNTQTGTAEENVLYLEGEIKYKYLRNAIIKPGTNEIVVPAGWVRVENGPNSYKKDGGRGTPVHENVHPQVQPKIFNEPVAFNGGVTIKGKKLEDLVNQGGGSSGDGPKVYSVTPETTLTEEMAVAMKDGDIIVVNASYGFVIGKEDAEDPSDILITGVFIDDNGYQMNLNWYVDNIFDDCTEMVGRISTFYVHNIEITAPGITHSTSTQIISSNSQPYTANGLVNWLHEHGYLYEQSGFTNGLNCVFLDASMGVVGTKMVVSDDKTIIHTNAGNGYLVADTTITDTVYEIE